MRNETGRVAAVLLVVVTAASAVLGFAVVRLSGRVADLEARLPIGETDGPGAVTPLALGGEVRDLGVRVDDVSRDQETFSERLAATNERLETVESNLGHVAAGSAEGSPTAVPKEKLEDAVAKLVEEKLAKMPKREGGEWKPTMDELKGKLELTDYQETRAIRVLDDAKHEVFTLASLKRPDGTAMVDDLVAAVTDPIDPEAAMRKWFQSLFTEKIPGRDEPYIAEIIRIKTRTENALVELLEKPQAKTLRTLNVDYLGVKTDYDPFAEYLQSATR